MRCGVGRQFQLEPGSVELFGLWVDPTARSTGVAGRLVDTAASLAAAAGATQMYYWAGTENGPAIGFATGFGFRVTSHRRPAPSDDHALGDTEIALVLGLEDDPHIVPKPPLTGAAESAEPEASARCLISGLGGPVITAPDRAQPSSEDQPSSPGCVWCGSQVPGAGSRRGACCEKGFFVLKSGC